VFLEKVAHYTMSPLGNVLKMALSCPKAMERNRQENASSLPSSTSIEKVTLSPHQEKALAELRCALFSQHDFSCALFEGVTGSGKTEVYLKLVRDVLDYGKQALILVPEIALTPQWIQRFERRFGYMPTLWHSALTPKQRELAWLNIIEGQAQVILGARSALFLPYPCLGLIVVDEEHEESYKQEDGVLYHGRDMAVLRASGEKIPILLSSATPAIETLWNVERGRYTHIHLRERFQATPAGLTLLPSTSRSPKQAISTTLREKLLETHDAGRQSLLFLNRRGFASYIMCLACQNHVHCPQCDLGLVYHKGVGELKCHICGYHQAGNTCPLCLEENQLKTLGTGVEKIQEELDEFMPSARIRIMSSDHTGSVKKMAHLIQELEERQIDILIGTQMVAKGHHFPHLTCVGILDADAGLHDIDFRARERLYQLLTQVAGRAGRGSDKGHVYLQTQNSEHPLFQAFTHHQQEDWVREELELRKNHALPPYSRMAALIIRSLNPKEAERYAKHLGSQKPSELPPHVSILGPAQAPQRLIRGYHRWRFLIRAPRGVPLQALIASWVQSAPPPPALKLSIDIDPHSFL
jgi:primosomal protein N' (replication factor Y)